MVFCGSLVKIFQNVSVIFSFVPEDFEDLEALELLELFEPVPHADVLTINIIDKKINMIFLNSFMPPHPFYYFN
jgi:hypothetical protein